MGNPKRPIKPWHNTPTRPIEDLLPGGGGGVVVDTMPLLTWTVALEHLTLAAQHLQSDTSVHGVATVPRFGVYAGDDLLGYVPVRKSTAIWQAMELHGGTLQGRVISASVGKVVVELSLEGR